MKTPFCNKSKDRDGMIIDEKDTKNDPFSSLKSMMLAADASDGAAKKDKKDSKENAKKLEEDNQLSQSLNSKTRHLEL